MTRTKQRLFVVHTYAPSNITCIGAAERSRTGFTRPRGPDGDGGRRERLPALQLRRPRNR